MHMTVRLPESRVGSRAGFVFVLVIKSGEREDLTRGNRHPNRVRLYGLAALSEECRNVCFLCLKATAYTSGLVVKSADPVRLYNNEALAFRPCFHASLPECLQNTNMHLECTMSMYGFSQTSKAEF